MNFTTGLPVAVMLHKSIFIIQVLDFPHPILLICFLQWWSSLNSDQHMKKIDFVAIEIKIEESRIH